MNTNTLKTILIAVGVLFLLLVLTFVILGVKVVGTVFFWILGFLLVLFLVGWIVYAVGRSKGRRDSDVAENV